MHTNIKNTFSLICGAPGSGKTLYAKKMCQNINRVICFDPIGEYAQLPEFITVKSNLELINLLNQDGCGGRPFKIAYFPDPSKDRLLELDLIFSVIFFHQLNYSTEYNNEPVTFLVDELTPSMLDRISCERAYLFENYKSEINKRLSLVWISQSPAAFPENIIKYADHLRCFRLGSQMNYGWVKKNIGKEASTKIEQLGDKENLVFSLN